MVITTVVLYYMLYIQYAVATSIITHFDMTYRYFVWVSVIGNAVGAFASLVAGLADRWGRANMVVYGLLIASLLVVLRAAERRRQGRVPGDVRAGQPRSRASSSSPRPR